MTETCKGIAIITNHFNDQANQPKIVYANKYLLNLLGMSLDQIVNQPPTKIFANWDNEIFIQEIIACVNKKVSWFGELDVYTKESVTEKKNFTITPVYDVKGDISYYSCITDVVKNCKTESEDNLVCLDDFVDTLWQYQAKHETNITKKRDLTKKLMALKGM